MSTACFGCHQRRKFDFRRGQRFGVEDHVVTWTKPERPEWMDEETYAQIPDENENPRIAYQGRPARLPSQRARAGDDDARRDWSTPRKIWRPLFRTVEHRIRSASRLRRASDGRAAL